MTSRKKERLDNALVNRGLVSSRSRARDLIKRGEVKVDGLTVSKPGAFIAQHAEIGLEKTSVNYISRAALKLEAAFDYFDFSPQNRVVLDLGASTGGFTDLLLRRGASQVYAVDVGHNQLHPSLTSDSRLISYEGIDARKLTKAHIPESVGAITADLSFISLTLALKTPITFAADNAWLIALVKPQFEVGRGAIGKGGIVHDEAAQEDAVNKVWRWLNGQKGWRVVGTLPSPITGQAGNKEFLLGAIYTDISE